ncbi:MAG TPA: hypothetical protein VF407_20740 [Polyangiaceae bacterium]
MHRRRAVGLGFIGISASVAIACSGSSGDDLGAGGDDNSVGGSDSGVDATVGTDSGPIGTSDSGSGEDSGPGGGLLPDGGRNFSTDTSLFYGGPSRCSTAGVKLCEDFETGTLDKSTWKVVGNAPTIDGTHTARGSKALHIAITGNGASMIQESKTFPATDNTYWGRIFVWFDKIPGHTQPDGGMTYSHWTFAYGQGTGATTGQIRLSGQLQKTGANYINHFGVGTDDQSATGTGDWTNSDNDPTGNPMGVPTGKWACIEWLHDGKNNVTRFFWDDEEHPSLATSATKHGGVAANQYIMPNFTSTTIGWQEYQASTQPFEMWVDEIAIDSQRIGCVQ